MRRYETIFIVRSTVGEDELTGIIDKVSSIVTNDSGTILKIDKWGIKKLAYPIKKESQGNYVYIDYAGVPTAVAEMERIFKIDDRLLKFMTVKLADSCDPVALLEEITTNAVEEAVESSVEEETAAAQPAEAAAESSPEEETAAAQPEEAAAESSAEEETADAQSAEAVVEKSE